MAISIIDDINSLTNLAQALGKLAPFLQWFAEHFRRRSHKAESGASYENISLTIRLSICDRRGRRAILERTQRVRFLAEEAGVLRDVVWGDGDALSSYRVYGAQVLAVKREGSKQIVLLGLTHRPARGEVVTVRSERTIVGGMTRREEYLETEVERDTGSLGLAVTFPVGRPPTAAFAESSPPLAPALPALVRLRPDGCAWISMRITKPLPLASYRLRWTW
jgi:hypothetical protein